AATTPIWLDSRPTPAATGIVLAGGRSSRFGRDKLAAVVDEEPLLARAIRSVAGVCREVIVVGRAEAAAPLALDVPVRFVPDRTPFAGPLAGLATGANAARESLLLVVAGDMPSLRPDVLRLMLQQLVDADGTYRYDVAQGVRLALDGRPEPLPLVIDRGAAISAAQDLATAGNSSLRALGSVLTLTTVAESDWRTLDPDGVTLHDVDRVEDLAAIPAIRESSASGSEG
ncbi:MAG: molybdenum cofactor guanylyltransferase, partial [Candidatus Limnocylindrales bacterium]